MEAHQRSSEDFSTIQLALSLFLSLDQSEHGRKNLKLTIWSKSGDTRTSTWREIAAKPSKLSRQTNAANKGGEAELSAVVEVHFHNSRQFKFIVAEAQGGKRRSSLASACRGEAYLDLSALLCARGKHLSLPVVYAISSWLLWSVDSLSNPQARGDRRDDGHA